MSGLPASLVWRMSAFLLLSACQLFAQNESALSPFFEGKQVVVKLDMPGTQQGVDVYPQRPQSLDVKSYSKRLKQFGTSLRSGDSVIITKVKIKDKGVEFQLAGGGYGTVLDDTDSSTHFVPSDKSAREKDLEDQIKRETDSDRRRSLQSELDDVRSARQRRDRRDLADAKDRADFKKQEISGKRQGGGSRFNIRFDAQKSREALSPQSVMAALSPYLTFPPDTFGPAEGEPSTPLVRRDPNGPPPPTPPPPDADPVKGLAKGMTRDQVEALFGSPAETHERTQDGMKVTECTFHSKDSLLLASFVNGVLVQYTLSLTLKRWAAASRWLHNPRDRLDQRIPLRLFDDHLFLACRR